VQVQVLHIIQEALSNVRKHAGATRVTLKVTTTPHWRFEVADDGIGFEPSSAKPGETSVGLRIMQERAQRIGASVRVQSAPGQGCRVVLELIPGKEDSEWTPSDSSSSTTTPSSVAA
jgi:two-component system nitrate/nitrite sensor histidine kinase NarX